MNLPPHLPVDADDARWRRLADVARLLALAALGVLLLVLGVSAWQRLHPDGHEWPPAMAVDDVAADPEPAPRTLESNEHDHEQRAYMTHGG